MPIATDAVPPLATDPPTRVVHASSIPNPFSIINRQGSILGVNPSEMDYSGDKTHLCPLCKKAFPTHAQLVAHVDGRHGSTLEALQGLAPPPVTTFSLLPSDFQAAQVFESPNAAAAQAEAAAGGKLSCPVCHKTFRLQNALTCHMSLAHGDGERTPTPATTDIRPPNPFGFRRDSFPEPSAQNMPMPAVAAQGPSFASLMAAAGNQIPPPAAPVFMPPPPPDPFTAALLSRPVPCPPCVAHLHVVACNVAVFVGVVDASGVTEGYVFTDPCCQLRLVTGDGEVVTVRCFRDYATDYVANSIDPGATLLVIGALRLVPSLVDGGDGFRYHPVVHVFPPMGVVHVLKP